MVEKEIVLPVERERAWELMTEEPEEWLADEVELEPEPGAPLRATWDDGEERTGVVEEVEPGRRLRFRWDDDAHGHPVARRVAARRGAGRHPRPRARDAARPRRGPRLDRPRHPDHRARPGEHAARGVTGPSKRLRVRSRLATTRRRLRRARGPDPAGGDRPARPRAALGLRAGRRAARSPARRSRSTSPRSTARAWSPHAAPAASSSTASSPRRWATRWRGWPPSARAGTSAWRGWRRAPSASATPG